MDLVNNKDIMGDIMEYCPYSTPRVSQEKAVKKIMEAINKGKKIIFLYAPTGAGKSGIARTLTDYYGVYSLNSFICTKTQQLQNQYWKESYSLNDYDLHFEKIIGKHNFTCVNLSDEYLGVHVACNHGLCTQVDFWEALKSGDDEVLELFWDDGEYCKDHCQWKDALEHFKKCNEGICNYHVLLSDNLYTHYYPQRKLLVCDEAHNLCDILRNFDTLTISLGAINRTFSYITPDNKKHLFNIKKFLKDKSYSLKTVDEWLNIIPLLEEYYDTKYKNMIIHDFKDSKEHYSSVIGEIKDFFTNMKYKRDKLLNNRSNYFHEVINNGDTIKFTPFQISRSMADKILNKGDVCILMSASFTNIDLDAELLGLKPDEYETIIIPDERDLINNNPLHYCGVGWLNKANREKLLPEITDMIKKIMSEYPTKKGVIHTPSYKYTEELAEYLDNPRVVYHKDPRKIKKNDKNNEWIMQDFKNSTDPLVLISPVIKEGVDFPDDECRFQILTVLPLIWNEFQNQLYERKPEEARRNLANDIIQMLGRGCRSKDDWCDNYLLDKRFVQCCFDNKDKMQWVKPTDFPKDIRLLFRKMNWDGWWRYES